MPDTHIEAPTGGSVILTGVLLKTGAYGLIRFLVPLFPEAARRFAPVALTLGAGGVIYGAIVAFSQTDAKRLVAYTSVSHLGFVLIAVFAWNPYALHGAVLEMVCHGLSIGGLFTGVALFVVLLAWDDLTTRHTSGGELYVLVLLATGGAAVLSASVHFASFFLGLEVLTVSLYGMIAYLRSGRPNYEAGAKHLLMAAAGSAFLLFGMALVDTWSGTMTFSGLATGFSDATLAPTALTHGGFTLILVGVGFKLALVPFHMWTPDVYQGASAPVAVLIRLVIGIPEAVDGLRGLLGAVAVLSMTVGNLLALLQDNLKRLLAYSPIAHLGYLMVAVLAGGTSGAVAGSFYLLTDMVAMLGAFGVVSALTARTPEAGELERLENYRGLVWRRPRGELGGGSHRDERDLIGGTGPGNGFTT